MAGENLDQVLADVTEEDTLIDSVLAAFAGVKTQLDAITAGSLPPAVQAKVDALFAKVEASKTKLNTAIISGTSIPPTA